MQSIYNNPPNHLVAVDCIVFGYRKGELMLLLFERDIQPAKGQLSLVGGFVNEDESVEEATERVLQNITGLENIFLKKVNVYSKPDRDPGGRVISIAFYALINIDNHDKELVEQHGATWHPVSQLPELIFDHGQMVNDALEKLRADASIKLIGRNLLPKEFTLTQLRQLYSSVYQKQFDPGNFRKKILSLNALKRLNKKDTSESKKGAFLYKYKPEKQIKYKERIINLINNKV